MAPHEHERPGELIHLVEDLRPSTHLAGNFSAGNS
jgi:hypothetical protein